MTDRTPTTEAGRRHLRWLIAGDDLFPEEALAAVLDMEDEARAPLVAALREVRTAVEAIPYSRGSHSDSFWSNAVGQVNSWHECTTNGLTHAAIYAILDAALSREDQP